MLKVFGVGRLTRDCEQKYSNGGKLICDFTVACDWYFGEKKTTFLRCKLFGKRAESLSPYLQKGTFVIIDGQLEISEYEGKYYMPEIIRRGLGFRLVSRGRSKVLTLLRQARNQ